MPKISLAVAVVALAAPALYAQPASPVGALVDRAVAAHARVTSARATFDQTITNPLTGTTASAKGEVVMTKSPNRFSVRFTDPAGDRIVADGRSVWVYVPSTNPGQVVKLPMGAAGTGPDVVNDLLERTRAKFTVSDAGTATIGGRATRAVQLVPKDPKQFTKAIVWIDTTDASVRQFELTEGTGLVRRIRLTSFERNVTVPESAFAFTPPKGVRVYDTTREQ